MVLRKLALGVVSQNSPMSDVLLEILDHQGICYEEIQSAPASPKTYPLVLVADDSSQDSVLLARETSGSPENVIVASQIVDLKSILVSLSGLDDRAVDRLDLVVNEEESKLRAGIREALGRQGLPLVRKWFWPNMAKACCVLSHDIDWLTYSPFHKTVIEGLGAIRALSLAISSIFRRRNFGNNIPETIEMEASHGFKSSFYFQTSYEKGQSLAEDSIKDLKERKFEIGLHGYHSSHKSADALSLELKKFQSLTGFRPLGLRYHILKFKVPETWLLESQAGFEYDATFFYNEYYGFRSGVCFPYHPFNRARIPILELPTGFMDWTALHRKDRNSKFASMLGSVKKIVEEHNGLLLVDFHNTYLNDDSFPDVYSAYDSLLGEIASGGYWVATASECKNWWLQRVASKPDPLIDGADQITYQKTGVPLVTEYEKKVTALT